MVRRLNIDMIQFANRYCLVAMLFSLFIFNPGYSANRTASQTGNWNNTTTWGGLSAPVAGDNVTIAAGYTVTVTADAACSAVQLGVSSGGDGTVAFNATYSLTVTGVITFGTSGGGARNGYADMTNGGTMISSSWDTKGGALTYGVGTVAFTGTYTTPTTTGFDHFYNLTINSSGTVTLGSYAFIYGSVTISAGVFSGDGKGMEVWKDWNVTGGSFTSGTCAQCYVTFRGTQDQHVDASSFHWVYFTTTVGNAYLDGDVTVTNLATFGTRIVYGKYGATNAKLIIKDGADAAAEGLTSYFEGAVKKVGNDAFQFPIGMNGLWAPLDITAPNTITDEITAQYFPVNPVTTFGSAKDGTIDHVSQAYYWQVTQNVGTTSEKVRLNWKGGSGGIDDLATLVVTRWDGSTWKDLGANTSGNTTTGDAETVANVPTTPIVFGAFTLASTSSTTNPLPVEFLSFDAQPDGKEVDVTWSTAAEFNSAYFMVQHSQDGIIFSDVAKVNAAGNSSAYKVYSSVDTDPYNGVSYYRLKQVDNDGKFAYSDIVAVNMNEDGTFSIYPNPTSGSFTLLLSGEKGDQTRIVIRDVLGKELYSKVSILSSGQEVIAVDPARKLTPGIYSVTAFSSRSILSKTLVVK